MFLYFLTENTYTSTFSGHYRAYDISVFRLFEYRLRFLFCVSDVSTDEKLASLIVSRCNRLQLDPVHLHDVIEDSFSPLWQEK